MKRKITKMLLQLKIDKSPGPDELHPRILKELATEITKPLSIIFKQSISLMTVPKEWRNTTFTAIFKKGDNSMPGNNRPVSLTSVVCKTMETIVKDHLTSHMRQTDLFSKKQFGFITGRSTTLQLLEILDKWTQAVDSGEKVDCIYVDLQKAFDKVQHRKMISKLKSYGIEDPILSWIKNYLSFRKQKVIINGKSSECKDVTSGIPQGSVLARTTPICHFHK